MNHVSGYTEKELLQLSTEGDEKAFAEIFHRYKFKLYGFIYRLTQSQEMAEDIVQETFLRLWKNRDQLGNIEHLSSYIFRMAQNQAITGFKRMAMETMIIRQLLTGEKDFSPSTPESELALKEMEGLFRKAVDNLPPQQKKVYLLSREEGLKHEEIAERLQISRGTVKNHMIQLLRTLRSQLEKNLDPPAGLYCFLLVIAAFER
jgi:RNA polymerase sigma-70 factor (ECF subfamily)